MKKADRHELLDRLEAETRQIILRVNYLLQEDPEVLTTAPAPDKWSVAQVIEHLNTYGRYYLPQLEKALINAPKATNRDYKPGMIGNYFTKIMLPEKGAVKNPMKAFKNHRPSPDVDSKQVLDEFLHQEQWLLQLLHKSRPVDIGRIKVPISIAAFIRLKAGDTLRFVVAHHQRHFVQVANTLEAVKEAMKR